MGCRIKGVSEIAFWVNDLVVAKRFYVDLLGCEIVDEDDGHNVFLKAGDVLIVLFDRESPNTNLANDYLARTGGARGDVYHVALRMDRSDLDSFGEELKTAGLVVKGPVDFAGGRRSYFTEDPDQHYIEFTDR